MDVKCCLVLAHITSVSCRHVTARSRRPAFLLPLVYPVPPRATSTLRSRRRTGDRYSFPIRFSGQNRYVALPMTFPIGT